MERVLYHGSANIIETPIYGFGKTYNDYGLGFYCTEDLDMAREWAALETQVGYVNTYSLDDSELSILRLESKEFTILNWLAILLENRFFRASSALAKEAKDYIAENFMIPYKDYDVITGHRADDSYFSFAQDFIDGTISLRQLSNAMKLGGLGLQYVLKSKRAFDSIHFQAALAVPPEEWFKKKKDRDLAARREYLDGERYRRQRGDLYITQILDEEMKNDDSRLR